VQSAPVNWHLFDTIDILKQATGTIEHLSTAALNTTPPLRSPLCSEQLAVPGVPKPAALSDLVSWGLIEGTGIGYIYVTGWAGDAGDRFALAIDELTQKRETDGLIIDFRHARGGNMFLSDADHYKMQPYVGEEIEYCGIRWLGFSPSLYVIDMCDRAFDPRSYDRPIAVLTGPRAASAGDQVALRMTFHPRARTFGKTTNTSFNAPCPLDLDPDWSLQYACADAYRIDQPHNYLTHDESVVDEPVWLQPDDVAQGRDTVVDAAIRWIGSQTASGE
jgi:C-terminal processing protease CtpA/Prc